MVNRKDQDEQRHQAQVPARNIKAGVREEEVCQIYNLKKNLDYSDILIKYANKYLKLGWDLVAVNAQGETALDLDFREPEEFWSPKLTTLGLEGVQINLGVRTGKPSHLLVLEVHRDASLAPFNQRGDWGSGCVAEVGSDREQHYYKMPRGWQPPSSYFLESFQIMVFGEEGHGPGATFFGAQGPGHLALAEATLGKPAHPTQPGSVQVFKRKCTGPV